MIYQIKQKYDIFINNMIYKIEEILEAVNEISEIKNDKVKKSVEQSKPIQKNNSIPPETDNIISDAEAYLLVKNHS